jgi:hypothetical protein
MRILRLALPGMAIGLIAWIAWLYGSVSLPHGAGSAIPMPEDGKVENGRYTSGYFDLTYPLPQQWTAGFAGPEPSQAGYYVLSSLGPVGDLDGTIMIAAQDEFFAAKQHADLVAAVGDFRDSLARVDGMSIDREPTELTIAGRHMQRVDFSGVGLYRAMIVTEIRCHIVSFNLTARSPEQLEALATTLDQISGGGRKGAPVCIKDYAGADTIIKRVVPEPAGSRYVPIPVRIIIDTEGRVKHVHVIHGTPEQRHAIDDALWQWKFKPPRVDGAAAEVETGLLFRFTSTGS